jgi:hypothetical protein
MPVPSKIGSYRHIDKDPAIDLFREAKRISGMKDEEIAAAGGPTRQTLRRWDHGGTRKPQRLSFRYAMDAMGFREVWMNGSTSIEVDYRQGKHFGKLVYK